MGTHCPRSTSYHKRLGVFFSQCHFLCPWNSELWKANTLQVICYFMFFFRKKAGSGTALSHHSTFLIFLLASHFVDWFHLKRSNLDTVSPFPTSTPVLPLQPGQQEQERAQTWQNLNTSSRLRNALLHLQPKLLTIFPNFCARTENTVLLFVC